MKTAIDWYFDKIKSHFEHDGDLLETVTFTYAIAKQKEKQQIIDAYANGSNDRLKNTIIDYYNETYGSKGTGVLTEGSGAVGDKGGAVTSSQTEISDEEIEKLADEFALKYYTSGVTEDEVSAFVKGMIKYREQLKKK